MTLCRSLAFLLAAGGLGARIASAGPPYRTDDPEPVEYQRWELYGFAAATQVGGDRAGILPGVEANYGAMPNVQLHILAPLVFDSPGGQDTRYGYGDTEFGIKYRFIQEDPAGWRPQVGTFPIVQIPTGYSDANLATGYTRVYLPLWVQKSIAEWTTYGGGGYWINTGKNNKDYWFVGWLLQRKLADQFTFGGEIFHQTGDQAGVPDSTGFNVGGIYDLNETYHILFSAGRGVQNVSVTNEFSWYLGLQWTH